MASTDKPATESAPRKSEVPPYTAPPPPADYLAVDVVLRILLFAATLVSVIVMVTSKQTKIVPLPADPGIRLPVKAKFNQSPAFIYFVAALSVACLYSIITILASFSVILKPIFTTGFLLAFAVMDVLVFGLVASATGAAGGVAYIGLRGNSHVGWSKVCNVYDTYCKHLGGSIIISLFAAVLLVLLIVLSIFSLHGRIRH